METRKKKRKKKTNTNQPTTLPRYTLATSPSQHINLHKSSKQCCWVRQTATTVVVCGHIFTYTHMHGAHHHPHTFHFLLITGLDAHATTQQTQTCNLISIRQSIPLQDYPKSKLTRPTNACLLFQNPLHFVPPTYLRREGGREGRALHVLACSVIIHKATGGIPQPNFTLF